MPRTRTLLRRFLRASQRGWQYSFDNRAEAAEIFLKAAPAFTQEIALLEIDGTMTIMRTERTKGKPIAWSDAERLEGHAGPAGEVRQAQAAARRERVLHERATCRKRRTCRRSSRPRIRPARPELRAMPHIRLQGVGKSYETKDGAVEACADINLDIRQSEFVAIVGPSGCGKTTILKMVAGPGAVHRRHDHRRRPARRPAADRRRHRVPGGDPARLARRAVERHAADRHPPHGPRRSTSRSRAHLLKATGLEGFEQQEALRALGRHAPARVDLPRAGARSRRCC